MYSIVQFELLSYFSTWYKIMFLLDLCPLGKSGQAQTNSTFSANLFVVLKQLLRRYDTTTTWEEL